VSNKPGDALRILSLRWPGRGSERTARGWRTGRNLPAAWTI